VNTVYLPATRGRTAPARIVLLPGAFGSPDGFLAAGFDAAVRSRELPLDLEFVALELAHVADRSMVDRLAQQIIAPARAAGCRLIWIGGISLGGFLALTLAARYPTAVDGLCLLAPYLGGRPVTNEIRAAGAASAWLRLQTDTQMQGDEDRELWRFIAQGMGGLPVWLGLGHQDRFLDRHRLLAAELVAQAVFTLDGGHDWPTWRKLWDNFLNTWTPQLLPSAVPGPPRPC
jgi:pimeloyl-ACP methyl ester carboxylesterase